MSLLAHIALSFVELLDCFPVIADAAATCPLEQILHVRPSSSACPLATPACISASQAYRHSCCAGYRALRGHHSFCLQGPQPASLLHRSSRRAWPSSWAAMLTWKVSTHSDHHLMLFMHLGVHRLLYSTSCSPAEPGGLAAETSSLDLYKQELKCSAARPGLHGRQSQAGLYIIHCPACRTTCPHATTAPDAPHHLITSIIMRRRLPSMGLPGAHRPGQRQVALPGQHAALEAAQRSPGPLPAPAGRPQVQHAPAAVR